jgi:hypothetical protein
MLAKFSQLHWKATYVPFTAPPPVAQTVESEITTGLLGVAARYTILPDLVVSPIVELAVGSAFQSQTGSNFNCSSGWFPGAELAVGARVRVAPWASLLATAGATTAIRVTDCGISDGAPATPFLASGYGLHAGLSFDLGLSRASTAPTAASR